MIRTYTSEKIAEIWSKLEENHLYPANVFTDASLPECVLCIEISWGDWKHDHARLRLLMSELFNATSFGEVVTEEDGSDCYSAVHRYVLDQD